MIENKPYFIKTNNFATFNRGQMQMKDACFIIIEKKQNGLPYIWT